MITKTDVKKFKLLYSQKFGVLLSDQDATKKLSQLIAQVAVIYQHKNSEANNNDC